ncbi:IS66 family insertion sequence element accessory protein TnpB [Lacticaseibacillus pantheris]|uniref:IS66 family insertion sequence element accessory protein TnpB n=1 Tax=Lacticaseibacillus pantheris TaxID=171523 RepID=UPI0034563024
MGPYGAHRISIAPDYADRVGILLERLPAVVQEEYQLDPHNQALYLFCGRRKDRFKALFWDGDGFILLYKRVENGAVT